MKWSNLLFLTAAALGAVRFAAADDTPAVTVVEGKPLTARIRVTAESDGDDERATPQVVVITDQTGAPATVDVQGAPVDAKSFTFRIVGDGGGVLQANANAPGGETKQVPFIGVVTSPLSAPVRAQTNLTEDVGLSVDSVAPDSPAAKAGLKAHDILAKYDDQILCAAVQLSALVKRTGTGNKAMLTVLRGGKEMPIEVIVGEHAAAATLKMEGLNIAVGQPGEARVVAGQPLAPEMLKLLQEMELTRGSINNVPVYGFVPRATDSDAPVSPQSPAPNASPLQPQADQFQRNQLQFQRNQNQFQRNQRFLLVNPNVQSQSQSVSIVANDDGRVELREVNGKRTVTILDKAGTQQYTGPLDTPDDRKAIPEALRSRVEQAEASAGPKTTVLPPLAAPVPVDPKADAESDVNL